MLKLMYITNNPEIAHIADENGVDRIFIDLEIKGKEKRQPIELNTVISRHSINDIPKVKEKLINSELLVRVNPIDDETPEEINKVIELGADIVMLPYFKTIDEIKNFLSIVNNRVKTCLLLETKEAVEILDDILKLEGIDEIHIGLNDLHLSYNMNFMFELLADGTVEKICNKIKKTNIKYGFGGVGRVGEQVMLPAENIIAEHYRLNSSMVILGRSFCDTSKIIDINELQKIFEEGIKKMREYEQKMTNQDYDFFVNNHEIIIKKVNEIVNITKNKKRGSNTK